MPTADRSQEENRSRAETRDGGFRDAMRERGAGAQTRETPSAVRPRTPWPGGRRRNWRAAFMLAAAALLMAAGLSLWSVIGL